MKPAGSQSNMTMSQPEDNPQVSSHRHTHTHTLWLCMCLFESQHCVSKQTFSWCQVLHVEGNWIGCNWLWSAGLNSKCWLCINIQIKFLFMLCVFVCTYHWASIVASVSVLIAKTNPYPSFLHVTGRKEYSGGRSWKEECGTKAGETEGANEGGQGRERTRQSERSEKSWRKWREGWGPGRCFLRHKPSSLACALMRMCSSVTMSHPIVMWKRLRFTYTSQVCLCVHVSHHPGDSNGLLHASECSSSRRSRQVSPEQTDRHTYQWCLCPCVWCAETSEDFSSPAEHECAVSAFKPLHFSLLPPCLLPFSTCLLSSPLIH